MKLKIEVEEQEEEDFFLIDALKQLVVAWLWVAAAILIPVAILYFTR